MSLEQSQFEMSEHQPNFKLTFEQVRELLD
jgi:hypothetical protein